MNQKHVPSIELCQQFVDLCSKNNITLPETEFYWVYDKMKYKQIKSVAEVKNMLIEVGVFVIPAPLVSEQGEWLPNERRDKLAFFSGLAINGWFCEIKNYRVMPYERFHVILQEETEANARMKCLNYLIAEGIITNL